MRGKGSASRALIVGTTFAIGLAGCGSAQAATRDFPVAGFDRVANRTPLDVRVHTGAGPSVRVEAPQQWVDRLRVEVVNGVLTISARRDGRFTFSREHATVNVDVPMLRGVEGEGPGNITVDRVRVQRFAATLNGPGNLSVAALEASTLDVTVNGPGEATFAGHAGSGSLAVHGPGSIAAARLVMNGAAVEVSGPGSLAVAVNGMVRGTLSGPGDIAITGHPRCDIRKQGPGSIRCG